MEKLVAVAQDEVAVEKFLRVVTGTYSQECARLEAEVKSYLRALGDSVIETWLSFGFAVW